METNKLVKQNKSDDVASVGTPNRTGVSPVTNNIQKYDDLGNAQIFKNDLKIKHANQAS